MWIKCWDRGEVLDFNITRLKVYVMSTQNLESGVEKKGWFNYTNHDRISGIVKAWLMIGVFMVFMQVVIGGITRLTGSGLSITKWEIVTGTLPPLNAAQWEHEFDLYKATPQYEKINQGMSMSEFKFIYFWEYFHRLWARSMGFVFLIPFIFFLIRGKLSKSLIKDLGLVVLFAALAASFGWIMVASGLVNRPWVNAYKLSIHLSIGFLVFCYLFWATLKVFQPNPKVINNLMLKRLIVGFIVILSAQIFLGGLMSGVKAGLFFPTFPDMNGEMIPSVILDGNEWNVDNLINYDKNAFAPAIIQFAHRGTAYLLIIMGLWYFSHTRNIQNTNSFSIGNILLITMLVIQALLGILTVINCKGNIPVGLGVAHQAGALALISIALFCYYQLRGNRM